MKSNYFKLLIIILVIGISLSACSFSASPMTQDQINTMTASTVAVQLTQISIRTLVAKATQLAYATSTPLPTETLAVTYTPTVTFTPTVTSTATVTSTPLFTNTPTMTATSAVPTATKTSTAVPIPCNQATWVTDVTIPDGTVMTAGQSFVKTWRITNSGTCNWTTGYSIYFVSGNSMSAPASVALTRTIIPGETVDLSVSMVAPGTNGDYTSNWMISAPNGSVFGVGYGGGVPLYASISVTKIPKPKDANTVYDFVGNYCSGQWRTNAGTIGCPTSSYDYKNGTITRSYAPILENGLADDEGALITIPATGGDGFIQGQFPKLLIHSGDRFKATLICTASMPKCSVTFELLYKVNGTNTVTSLGAWDKKYDNTGVPVDVDLSALDGSEVIFYLKVSSKGNSTNDFAQWMAARITHP